MHERQVEKSLPCTRHLFVEAGIDGKTGHVTGLLFRGKGFRLVAKHIQGKLIEKDDQCKATLFCSFPMIQLALTPSMPESQKAIPDLLIEFRC